MIKYISLIFACLNAFEISAEYEDLSCKIIDKYKQEVLAPRCLFVSSIGSSSNKEMKAINIGVDARGPGSISEGRKSILLMVDELARRYNTDNKIRPFLEKFPLTVKNFGFTISYLDDDGDLFVIRDVNDEANQIAYISMQWGKISYCLNLSKEMMPLKKIHTETYEEAKKIGIEEQMNNNSKAQWLK